MTKTHANADCDWADDLSWIVGRIRRQELEGGFLTLEFGDEHAPERGSVVLGNAPQLAGLADGDLVRVEGVADPDRMTMFMAGTWYDVTDAHAV